MFCPVLGLAGIKQDHRDETVPGCFKIFSHLGSSMMKIHHHNKEEEAAAAMSKGKSVGKNVLAWAHQINSDSCYDKSYRKS